MTVVAVLGLGEAGSAIAADLVAAGAVVRVFDPHIPAPSGTTACTSDADAARGADVVLSVNSAAEGAAALHDGLTASPAPGVWADLNTASPALERDLARVADEAGQAFADVSLMAPVPGRGLHTPMLASGDAAPRFAELLRPLGANIEVLEAPAGEASARKLLRSVFFKGMAAAVVEALTAARAAGLEDWLRDVVVAEFDSADAAFARRLEDGTYRHAVRRAEEMRAATDLLTSLGVPARISAASRDWLQQLAGERVPGATPPA